MPDFLNRLAARALGTLPLAEPLLSTRFEFSRQHVVLSPFGFSSQPEESREAGQEFADRKSLNRGPLGPLKSGFALFDTPSEDPVDMVQSQTADYRHVLGSQNLPRQFVGESHTDVALNMQAPTAISELSPTTSGARYVTARDSSDALAPAPPLSSKLKLPLFNPLPDAARVPERSERQRRDISNFGPATVRVSIGRIEVRAELVARTAAPVSRPAQASHISLEQFLKQAGGTR